MLIMSALLIVATNYAPMVDHCRRWGSERDVIHMYYVSQATTYEV
jgi:hypothetical protein